MHALGNNYVYVSLYDVSLQEKELVPLAIAVSDVRTGIGSDGLILIGPSTVADVRMRIFNADGSEAETCGNGLRCVAKYAYDKAYVRTPVFNIEVASGIVAAHVHVNGDGVVETVTIDMGAPHFGPGAVVYKGDQVRADSVVVEAMGQTFEGMLVSMGNPHFVTFVDDARAFPVAEIGPSIERNQDFPTRLNVEFVTVRNRAELDFRVWERGSGITYACGTGACAAVAAGVRAGLLDSEVTVHLLGGDLHIVYSTDRVLMTGEAVYVLSGEFQWRL